MLRTVIAALCLSCGWAGAHAETQVLPVWPAGAPGSIARQDYSEKVSYWNGDRSWPILTRVSRAMLEVYPAEQSHSRGAAVVICPGGGYVSLNIDKEGHDVARWLSGLGLTAFVLKYRLPNPAIMKETAIGPLQDVQEALRLVRRNAAKWQVQPDRVGVMGFSSGGHVAATASTLYSEKTYEPTDATSARPDFAILVYPLISMRPELTPQGLRRDLLGAKPAAATVDLLSAERHVTAQTPPTFIVHSRKDQAVPVAQSIHYADALKKQGVPVELHLYDQGNHAYGIGALPDWPSAWPGELQVWLAQRHLISSDSVP